MRIPLEFLVIDSGSGFDPVQLKLEPEIALVYVINILIKKIYV